MCLAQGPQRSDAGGAEPAAPRSRVKLSTTALLDIVELEHTLGVAVSLGLVLIFMSSILGGGT